MYEIIKYVVYVKTLFFLQFLYKVMYISVSTNDDFVHCKLILPARLNIKVP